MTRKPRNQRQRGLHVLLWTGIYVLLAQVSAGVLIDRFGLWVRFPEAAERLRSLAQQPSPPNILTFGSSRMGGVSHNILETEMVRLTGDNSIRVFNMAVAAGDPVTSDFMLEQVLRLGFRPRLVLIEISPEFLAEHNPVMHYHVRRETTWHNLPTFLPEIIHSGKAERFLATHLCPLHFYRQPLMQELGRLWQDGWESWWSDYQRTWEWNVAPPLVAEEPSPQRRAKMVQTLQQLGANQPWAAAPRLQIAAPRTWDGLPTRRVPTTVALSVVHTGVQDWLKDYRAGGFNLQFLERILQHCEEHGIVPLVITTPVSQSLRGLQTPEVNTAFDELLRQLRQKYAFHFRDYRNFLPDDLMRDVHHFTSEGGECFSEYLAQDLLAPAWRAWQP